MVHRVFFRHAGKMPAKGEWLITTSNGEHVSKLTVDLERVFMSMMEFA